MSTCVRRQFTHMLAGFDSMGTPHSQQRLKDDKFEVRIGLLLISADSHGDLHFPHSLAGRRSCSNVIHGDCVIRITGTQGIPQKLDESHVVPSAGNKSVSVTVGFVIPM